MSAVASLKAGDGHTFCILPAALGPPRSKTACRQVCPLALRQTVIVQGIPTGSAHPLEPLSLQALQAELLLSGHLLCSFGAVAGLQADNGTRQVGPRFRL